MRTRRFPGRAFERTLRSPTFRHSGGENEAEGDEPARKFYYLRLMRVSIWHNYYSSSNGACPDFTIYPTAASEALMRSLGLLFRSEVAGFSILYDVRRKDILLSYLKRQEWPPESKHCWARLSFVLSLNNPYFLNFTDIPINLNPAVKNFYFTNQHARRRDGRIILNPGPVQEMLNVVPVQFGVLVSDEVKEVEVQDIAQVYEGSEESVICRPRCVPRRTSAESSQEKESLGPCEEARRCKGPNEPKEPGDPECDCTNKLYLDFALLPEDKYTIKRVFYPSVSAPVADGEPVLYTESYPTPLCFVNLFFTSPTGERSRLFPVRDLFDEEVEPTVGSVDYELQFERRLTYWNYFIVPQVGESLRNLRIEGEAAIRFNGPCSVNLPDGRKAYRFLSKTPLPFIQQSPFCFRLTGEIESAGQTGVLVERLPVASAEQVLQDEFTACLNLERGARPGAKTECRKLRRQICRCVCAGYLPVEKCLKVLQELCTDPQDPRCQERRLGCSNIYSDTYVYV